MKHLGKGWAWWAFKWPVHRRKIRFYWERDMPRMAASHLLSVLPEAKPGTREMVKYLAKKYHWKIKEVKV